METFQFLYGRRSVRPGYRDQRIKFCPNCGTAVNRDFHAVSCPCGTTTEISGLRNCYCPTCGLKHDVALHRTAGRSSAIRQETDSR